MTAEELRAAYEAGAPSTELGARLGVTHSTILRWLRAAGATIREPGCRRVPPERVASLWADYLAGKTLRELAEAEGRSVTGIWGALTRAGYRLRHRGTPARRNLPTKETIRG